MVLTPVEETTQSISKETATLSFVILNIQALLRTWENKIRFDPMKEEKINSKIKIRIAEIKEQLLLSIETLVDPCVKDQHFQKQYDY